MSPLSQAQGSESAPPRLPAHRWRLQVVHRTEFHYGGAVRSSYNEARLTPENSNRQTTLRSRVEIEPAATAYAYRDYWGSTVTAFDLHSPHSELVVTGTSIVEAGPDLAGHDRVGWSALAAREVREQFGELLAQLPARLEELQRTCSAASAAVTHRFFTEQAPQVWVPEGVG